jgi:hypothetical protein
MQGQLVRHVSLHEWSHVIAKVYLRLLGTIGLAETAVELLWDVISPYTKTDNMTLHKHRVLAAPRAAVQWTDGRSSLNTMKIAKGASRGVPAHQSSNEGSPAHSKAHGN